MQVCTSLQTDNHANTPPLSFFTGRMPFLPPNQQRQSTEGTRKVPAGTRKVKPIWTLLKQETVSGSGISWAICKSATRSRQTTMPAPHHSVFYRPLPFLPPNQQRQSTAYNNYSLCVKGEYKKKIISARL